MITVIDYEIINLASVKNALAKLAIPFLVSNDPHDIEKAEGLLLPGVGAAGEGMKNLQQRGLTEIIRKKVKDDTPILGICLGMQLLLSESEEGNVDCLDILPGSVKLFQTSLKVPEIGWNNVKIMHNESKIMKNIPDSSFFYFVHSYFCDLQDKSSVAGITDYDGAFCSVFEKENVFGVQFHPEKSGDVGLQILKNFSEIL